MVTNTVLRGVLYTATAFAPMLNVMFRMAPRPLSFRLMSNAVVPHVTFRRLRTNAVLSHMLRFRSDACAVTSLRIVATC